MAVSLQEALAQGVESHKFILGRFFPGFTDENRTRQSPGLPNHLAWCLGHLAMTMHEVAHRLGDGLPDRPEPDFIKGDGTEGDLRRFDTESVSFKSTPVDDPSRYPALDRCVAIFHGAIDRLAGAVRRADISKLEQLTPWGPSEIPLWLLVQRMSAHNGMHTGQVIDLRRALGMGRVLG